QCAGFVRAERLRWTTSDTPIARNSTNAQLKVDAPVPPTRQELARVHNSDSRGVRIVRKVIARDESAPTGFEPREYKPNPYCFAARDNGRGRRGCPISHSSRSTSQCASSAAAR